MVPMIGGSFLVFLLLGHQSIGRQQEGGNAGRVAERGAHDFGRVNDAHLHQVAVIFTLGVEAQKSKDANRDNGVFKVL